MFKCRKLLFFSFASENGINIINKKIPEFLETRNSGNQNFTLYKPSYKEEPKPEYAPKKNSVNKPPAASPPTVATIQRGTLPISLILIKVF